MRVAIFSDTYPPQVNGVARTLSRLVATLRERGHEARVFTTSDPRAADEAEVRRYPGAAFWSYPELRIGLPRADLVRRELEAWGPNLVHVATPFGVGLAARTAARALGLPMVTSYHTSLSEYARFYGLGFLSGPGWSFLRWFHNSGLRTYVPTHAIRRELAARGFLRTAVWSRGVDTTAFSPLRRDDALRCSLGADDDTVVVSYVGRLAREKGLDLALDAMHAVRASCGDRVRFVVVGDGPYESRCRQHAPAGTVFLGRLEGHALSAAYASSDIQLFPSTTDTFGNVLLEGMASGLAVVAVASGPTEELLHCGRGVVVPSGDHNALARAVAHLVNAPERRLALGRAGLCYARSRGWPQVFDGLFDDYARVMVASAEPPRLRARRATAAVGT